jgi:hypothetical protein
MATFAKMKRMQTSRSSGSGKLEGGTDSLKNISRMKSIGGNLNFHSTPIDGLDDWDSDEERKIQNTKI